MYQERGVKLEPTCVWVHGDIYVLPWAYGNYSGSKGLEVTQTWSGIYDKRSPLGCQCCEIVGGTETPWEGDTYVYATLQQTQTNATTISAQTAYAQTFTSAVP